jgi:Fe-S cluster assembly protein SufD
MPAVAERQSGYAAAFDAFRKEPAFGPDWLRTTREEALLRFLKTGFPTTREEEWRFTSVAPIAEVAFGRPGAATPDRRSVEPFLLANQAAEIVLVNGRVSKTLSSLDRLPAGVKIEGLADAAADLRPVLSVNGHGDAFADLHRAFFEDAVVITIAPGTVVDAPLHVVALAAADSAPLMMFPRIVVKLGEGAQASLVESYGGLGDGKTLTSPVTSVSLGANAVLHHVKLQRESASAYHVARLDARLSRSSTFTTTAITLGGRIARNDIVSTLDGEGAECTLNGLYVADGDALTDTHTTIDHAKAHCPSHEVYKGILGGKAKAVFNGKIIVRQDAQKTNAKQTNKALLLSDEAQINTKPQLEIFADDVKCTHGAAIGQLDEDAMFYMRARGIAEADARNLMIHAFAAEVLDGVKVEAVRERAMRLIEEKLKL